MNALFFLNSALLGVGLAMDAFSVSLARGLVEPHMKKSRMALIAGTFAAFQFAMPMIGWICVHTIANYFTSFQRLIPWIALALLGYIGSKMLIEGIQKGAEQKRARQNAEKHLANEGCPKGMKRPSSASVDNVEETVAESIEAEKSTDESAATAAKFGVAALMVQGIATSIDALSVGFTIADYGLSMAFICSIIVAAVTYVICTSGILIGRAVGTKLSGKADILGGVILIGIGIEIFVKGVFFG